MNELDFDLGYSFSPQKDRPRFEWPNGNCVAVIFHMPLLHWETLATEPESAAGTSIVNRPRVRGAPDIGTHAWWEFGYRVGIWRLMSLFDKFGIALSCPLAVRFAEEYPMIMREVLKRGWEVAAHGYSHGDWMPNFTGNENKEREFIRKNLADFERVVGRRSEGWISPAVTPTAHTAKIVASENVKFYCDYQNDDQPYIIKSDDGPYASRTVCVPYSTELSDNTLYLKFHYSPDEVFSIMKEHFDYLYDEGQRGQAKIMHIAMHPYVSGQAYRVRTLQRMVEYMAGHEKVWFTKRGEVANWYLKQI